MIPAVFLGLCPSAEELRTHRRATCIEEELMNISSDLDDFKRFFESCLGFPPWEVQLMWAKRVLARRSFAAIAPTGVGKTAFGSITSIYFPRRGWGKSYLILPTSLLVDQIQSNLMKYLSSSKTSLKVLSYKSRMNGREKSEFMSSLESGDFDILVTTSQYLSANYELLKRFVEKFSFVFVDDVDSFLKNSKNVDKVLKLMGFNEEDIRKASRGEGVSVNVDSVLVVSTATGKPGKRAALFRSLLGFEIGIMRPELLRNVVDMYTRNVEDLKNFALEMGGGFLLFVPSMALADEALKLMESADFRGEVVHGYEEGKVKDFSEGKLDFLIGAAKPYGVLVRGVDLPKRIRYVIFYGTPRFELTLKDVDEMKDSSLAPLFLIISKALNDDAKKIAIRIRRSYREEDLKKARQLIKDLLSDEEKLHSLSSATDVVIDRASKKIVVPDVRTYIQGSGRTSRLFPGGITRGTSLLWDEGPMLTAFIKRAKAQELDFLPLSEVDVKELKVEVDRSRELLSSIRSGYEYANLMKTALFIVESPNKAKTIARFFGRPNRRFLNGIPAYEVTTGDYVLTVVATGGHVVDLSTKVGYHGVLVERTNGKSVFVPVYSSIRRCNSCGNQFTDLDRCPRCGSYEIRDSRSVIENLRKLSFEVSRVIIGTDPDTEGEKIAWDVYQLIRDASNEIYRAEFHEVTKGAIIEALRRLREINERMIGAQIVRRVEDRWIGFELSAEVQEKFGRKYLSAGRAQTPVLGWVIERYKEHQIKRTVSVVRGEGILLRLDGRIGEKGPSKLEVRAARTEEEVVKPPPPFTTDSMLSEANRVLRIGASRTMQLAQFLFEAGLITYHRTDSVRVSDVGLRVASIVLGEGFFPRKWGEGGAHECIRPTKPLSAKDLSDYLKEGLIAIEGLTRDHLKLYDLIFRRFIASQSKEGVLVKQIVKAKIGSMEFEVVRLIDARGGWLDWYPFYYKLEPKLDEGTYEVFIEHQQVPSVPLYTQSHLIALMKERGIGRPSTYANIVEKILQRGYVIERGEKLIPTKLGIEVHRFLASNFPDLINEERTRILERKMDSVEEGISDYQDLLNELYNEIKEKVITKRSSGKIDKLVPS
ncbi:MAG: reverse gyrase [Candidatus Korarchaeum sp.]|nr:reverse gyrase [Candidatus Korarchaeum sp.]